MTHRSHDRSTTRSGCPFHSWERVDFEDPVFALDPYVSYAELRKHEPIHRTVHSDGRPVWLITQHVDALKILRDERFVKNRRSTFTDDERRQRVALPSAMGYLVNLLATDPPQHTRLRGLIARAFMPREVERWRQPAQAIADAALDAAIPHGRIELLSEYALPLPFQLIMTVLGIPPSESARFQEYSIVTFRYAGRLDGQSLSILVPVLETAVGGLQEIVCYKRHHPGDDLISSLLEQSANGESPLLSDDELIAMCLLLISAGHETTANLICNGMLALLDHPRQLEFLLANPLRIPLVIDELMRFLGPVHSATLRYAREDVDFEGVSMRRGDLVQVVLASANRDDHRFPNADSLDLSRDAHGHLALGHGIHYCLGAALARIECEVAWSTLLRRTRHLRLAVDRSQLKWTTGPLTRGLESMPLMFDPSI